MNEQFRVAQKLGLMFRPEESLPDDIKSWAMKQLKAKSPALGVNNTQAKKFRYGQINFNPTCSPEITSTANTNITDREKKWIWRATTQKPPNGITKKNTCYLRQTN